jgi:hypothetical protein
MKKMSDAGIDASSMHRHRSSLCHGVLLGALAANALIASSLRYSCIRSNFHSSVSSIASPHFGIHSFIMLRSYRMLLHLFNVNFPVLFV